MSKEKKETTQERLERMKREREEAAKKAGETDSQLVDQLTHKSDGEPNFAELAQKLQERQEQESKSENADHVKMTMYIRRDIYDAFNALITRRGQQKEFTNQALSDFVLKKAKELNL